MTSAPSILDLPDLNAAALPGAIAIPPLPRPFDADIRPPGSKSLTNRLLLLAALASGRSVLRGALVEADDAKVMLAAVHALGAGVAVQHAAEPIVTIDGVGGRWRLGKGAVVRLDLHNAGTATRFLTAAALLAPPDAGGVVIDGNARMRQRPIGELVTALNAMGVQTRWLGEPGLPPVMVMPAGADGQGGAALRTEVTFGAVSSSQFISAVMLVAPCLPQGLHVRLVGVPTSEPYIAMTLGVLRAAGCSVEGHAGPGVIKIGPGVPAGFDIAVEPDASGASYFVAARALVPGSKLRIPGLVPTPAHPHAPSLQGDATFLSLIEQRSADGGAATPWSLDLSGMPDMAMTAAVLAAFAHDPASGAPVTTELRGLRTLRVKETDRIAAIATEMGKLGVRVDTFSHPGRDGTMDEGVRITPPASPIADDDTPVSFRTYDDHRMAMSLALVGLRRRGVTILDPACVSKTYPTFWKHLRRLYPL